MACIKTVFVRKCSSRLNYKTNKRKGKKNYIFLIMIYILLIFLGSVFFENKVYPTFYSLAKTKAHHAASIIVEKELSTYLNKQKTKYSDFYTLEKNDKGEITALISNTTNMNRMKADMMLCVLDSLHKVEDSIINIPLLSFTGNLLIADMGPKLPIKVLTTGHVEMDFENEFKSVGINQIKHMVYIECHSEITLLMPGRNSNAEIETKIPVTEAILVGDVPNTVLNLNKELTE